MYATLSPRNPVRTSKAPVQLGLYDSGRLLVQMKISRTLGGVVSARVMIAATLVKGRGSSD